MSNSIEIDNNSSAPLWSPSLDMIEASQIHAFMMRVNDIYGLNIKTYDDLHQWSINHSADFWSLLWDFCDIIGDKGDAPYLINDDKMAADKNASAQFFPHATLNFAENLLKKKGETEALVFRSENDFTRDGVNDTAESVRISWDELHEQVSQFAQGLRTMGVMSGDRVCGFMPNMPETIIAMLAAASIGAVWASASPDFGVDGVLDRFGQIEPKVMIAVHGYYYNGKVIDCTEKLNQIVAQLPTLTKIVMVDLAPVEQPFHAPKDLSISYDDFIIEFVPEEITFARLPFDHPLYIMFSSGTTGIPKCIVHGAGGTLLQQLKEHRLHCDVREDSRVFYFTTCGWMMWNWLVAGLGAGATLLLYDGSPLYPHKHVLWDYTDSEKCYLFGTSAKFIDAIKKRKLSPKKRVADTGHDFKHLRVLTSTGSPLVPESFDYIYDQIKSDLHVASISGGTDIISCFALGNPISPVYRGEIQCAGLGMDVRVYDEDANTIDIIGNQASVQGELVCANPFPSMPVCFWRDENNEKYHEAYFDRFNDIVPNGVWCHGDWIEKTATNGFIIHGRSDATLNPGGVRIGTAEIYRQVEQLDEIIEAIVVGQNWQHDVRVVLFVILADGMTLNKELTAKIKATIRKGATPRHVPAKILTVTDIPRTKSGKITEIAVRHIVEGRMVKNTQSLANPEALEQFKNRSELQD